jgi:hypothetical protein
MYARKFSCDGIVALPDLIGEARPRSPRGVHAVQQWSGEQYAQVDSSMQESESDVGAASAIGVRMREKSLQETRDSLSVWTDLHSDESRSLLEKKSIDQPRAGAKTNAGSLIVDEDAGRSARMRACGARP